MPLVDLHLHSCCSDGTRTPAQVARALADAGIGVAALADHEGCAGYEDFAAACTTFGIRSIRGMELTCIHRELVLHMLAYGFAPTGRVMAIAAENRRLLLEMSRDLIDKMSYDFPTLTLADYDSWDYQPTLGGWKGLHYLVERGVTATPEAGMVYYSRYGCDYSLYPFPTVADVASAIREAGGIPVLAHPGNWYLALEQQALYRELDDLRTLGIGGIECHYPSHGPDFIRWCTDYCKAHGLLRTAGSDCHGDFVQTVKGVQYGIGQIQVGLHELNLGGLLDDVHEERSKLQ